MEAVEEVVASGARGAKAQFEARPIAWRLGSEILGLDLKRSEDITDDSIEALWRLLWPPRS